jgi:hypothetical protein
MMPDSMDRDDSNAFPFFRHGVVMDTKVVHAGLAPFICKTPNGSSQESHLRPELQPCKEADAMVYMAENVIGLTVLRAMATPDSVTHPAGK